MATKDTTAKDALANGAEEIRKAKAAQSTKSTDAAKAGGKSKDKPKKEATTPPPPEPSPIELLGKNWKPSTRNIGEILAERITMAPGHVGVVVNPNTPLDETLPILDYFTQMGEHVGFFIGDVLLAGEAQHGVKFEAALAITGRALPTLKAYKNTAKSVPIEMRQAALSFSVHREVARLVSPEKKVKLLTEAAQKVTSGKPFTKKDMRHAAVKAEPPTRSKPAAKKATSGKGGKKGKGSKPAPPPHEYTAEEQAIHDDITSHLEAMEETLASKAGQNYMAVTLKTDNKEKRKLAALLSTLECFAVELEKHTGY